MALFSKLYEGECHPYDLKGRWYRVHVKSGNVIESDIPEITVTGSSSSTSLSMITDDLKVVDYVVENLSPSIVTSNVSFTYGYRYLTNGKINILIPASTWVDEIIVFLYCIKI